MTDMLVKLYNLPEIWSSNLVPPDIKIRKPIAAEKSMVVAWVRGSYNEFWASETDTAFARSPVSCYVAQSDTTLIGFACYDTSALGYFGPMGVVESFQRRGIGKALLLACLQEMKLKGYGYAVVGWVGPQQFYEKAAGAISIPDSTPGIWKDWLGGFE